MQIENIYGNFLDEGWYQKNQPEQYSDISQFLTFIAEKQLKFANVPPEFEIPIDNLYISILNVANPELTDEYAKYNQSMVIKVNNMYKSMIFMGNIANYGAEKFKDNNLDEIDCDAVQISTIQSQSVSNEIYKKMTPDYIFVPNENGVKQAQELINIINPKDVYYSSNGDVTSIIK